MYVETKNSIKYRELEQKFVIVIVNDNITNIETFRTYYADFLLNDCYFDNDRFIVNRSDARTLKDFINYGFKYSDEAVQAIKYVCKMSSSEYLELLQQEQKEQQKINNTALGFHASDSE